ncbi:hypothetical protein EZV62_022372 [Acer yangbiense]|uniref:shikimate kinase n=1 Tax=Acer yangbiense TaxID=1000413 RepID=A0A5C7H800_9ROSI|nr:hypothetical protein EZV62_022372 [Acer yangbiense]
MEAMGGGSALQFRVKQPKLFGFNHKYKKEHSLQLINLNDLNLKTHTNFKLLLSHCHKDSQNQSCSDIFFFFFFVAPILQSGNFGASFDGDWLLKTKGKEVTSCLNGRNIYLVGMMGSGKTTVGKILSESLSYLFNDSDDYVEEAMGGTSVAQIFKQGGESIFREYETEALQKLSMMPRQVVATGGGAVIRPINWRYMRQGITVFLDVPLDALARRIAAVGTDTRPLLHFDSGDAYTKAFMRLLTLSKKRSEAYANADATVSLLTLAASLQLEDVLDITPITIATEVLVQIEKYLRDNNR